MASDRTFLLQRLALVEHRLANPDGKFVYAGQGRVRLSTKPPKQRDTRYRREARVLRKLLDRTNEGQALATLRAWRHQLGMFLFQHRQRHKDLQDAYDAWWELPWRRRQIVPRPAKPPSPRYVDRDGAPWIIDDRFLMLLDDLIQRLQKWLDST